MGLTPSETINDLNGSIDLAILLNHGKKPGNRAGISGAWWRPGWTHQYFYPYRAAFSRWKDNLFMV